MLIRPYLKLIIVCWWMMKIVVLIRSLSTDGLQMCVRNLAYYESKSVHDPHNCRFYCSFFRIKYSMNNLNSRIKSLKWRIDVNRSTHCAVHHFSVLRGTGYELWFSTYPHRLHAIYKTYPVLITVFFLVPTVPLNVRLFDQCFILYFI